MPISVSVRGIEQLKAFLAKVPVETRKIAVREVSMYIIGNDSHGLRHMVNYKYVSRKAAYGQTFVSDKQRRYVMAKIKSGEITPGRENRTGAIKRGWEYKTQGGGYGATIYNKVKGTEFVHGDATQARQPRMVGHRTLGEIISTNIKGAMVAANAAISRWLKINNK